MARKQAPKQTPKSSRVPAPAPAPVAQKTVKQELRETAKGAAVAVVETALDTALELFKARMARAARAPAHVVSSANLVNGMHPDAIVDKVNAAMDAHDIE